MDHLNSREGEEDIFALLWQPEGGAQVGGVEVGGAEVGGAQVGGADWNGAGTKRRSANEHRVR